jgi:uroporphyrinogen decarboxylase
MACEMTEPLNNQANRFLQACAGAQVDTTPIWIMRQAGRYLPDYQRTRARAGDFLTLCKTPELACEVTVQPVERLGVDAAILFSDILIPLEAMGLPLAFTEEGPKVRPVRSGEEIEALRVPEAAECGFVMEAVRLCRRELAGRVPLIGFAGAPFTMLTYAVEGQTGKQFVATKKLLFAAPEQAHLLLDKITETVIAYLRGQVAAGAQALQLFDSWVGVLGVEDFVTFAAPYVRRVLTALRPLGVPLIYFANGGAALLEEVGKLPADVFALDWRLPIGLGRQRLGIGGPGDRRAVQGNLDPMVLFGPVPELERRVRAILADAPPRGHVFNLGHGILPETPVPHVQALVEMVHRLGAAVPRDGRDPA